MTEEDAFLQAIIENPDDDGPRLIYADWLDEHDHSDRAEFIRIQCAIAQMDRGTAQFQTLAHRQWELFSMHEKEWVKPFRLKRFPGQFERGFIDHVWVNASTFVRWAKVWFRCSPTRRATICKMQHYSDRFFALPQLNRLTALTLLSGLEAGDCTAAIRSLADCPQLARLTDLTLSEIKLDATDIQVFCSSPHLREVCVLNLSRSGIGFAEVGALVKSPLANQLATLVLSWNPIGSEGIRV